MGTFQKGKRYRYKTQDALYEVAENTDYYSLYDEIPCYTVRVLPSNGNELKSSYTTGVDANVLLNDCF